jgi:hypothetical protein
MQRAVSPKPSTAVETASAVAAALQLQPAGAVRTERVGGDQDAVVFGFHQIPGKPCLASLSLGRFRLRMTGHPGKGSG